ncbi:cytochrome b [Terrarubrum flagellatum]|uniref:cytochrome b n=1 Tax=Terrirubrum flagellatum TaxID=2895980 RepID=UPI003144F0B1
MSIIDTQAESALEAPGTARPLDHRLVARALHWLTAALIGCMVASGVVMTQLGGGSVADTLMSAHKLCGFVILMLLLARLAYRIIPRAGALWRQRSSTARFAHLLLYAVAILTCLLGLAGASDFGAREALFGVVLPQIWPEGFGWADALFTTHAFFAFALLTLVCIHVGFALQDYIGRGQRD